MVAQYIGTCIYTVKSDTSEILFGMVRKCINKAAGTQERFWGKWGSVGGSIKSGTFLDGALAEMKDEALINPKKFTTHFFLEKEIQLKPNLHFFIFYMDYNYFINKFPRTIILNPKIKNSSLRELDTICYFKMNELEILQNREFHELNNNFLLSYFMQTFENHVIPYLCEKYTAYKLKWENFKFKKVKDTKRRYPGKRAKILSNIPLEPEEIDALNQQSNLFIQPNVSPKIIVQPKALNQQPNPFIQPNVSPKIIIQPKALNQQSNSFIQPNVSPKIIIQPKALNQQSDSFIQPNVSPKIIIQPKALNQQSDSFIQPNVSPNIKVQPKPLPTNPLFLKSESEDSFTHSIISKLSKTHPLQSKIKPLHTKVHLQLPKSRPLHVHPKLSKSLPSTVPKMLPPKAQPLLPKIQSMTLKTPLQPKLTSPKAILLKAIPPKAIPPKAIPPKAIPPKAIPPKAIVPKAVPPKAILPKAISTKPIPPKVIASKAILPKAILPKNILPKVILPKAIRS
jgi:hypothetical protein